MSAGWGYGYVGVGVMRKPEVEIVFPNSDAGAHVEWMQKRLVLANLKLQRR